MQELNLSKKFKEEGNHHFKTSIQSQKQNDSFNASFIEKISAGNCLD